MIRMIDRIGISWSSEGHRIRRGPEWPFIGGLIHTFLSLSFG